jgi:predicted AAA+ superfamily ATPase
MIHRDVMSQVLALSSKLPALAVLGPRQSGKTTLARACFPKHRFVNLDQRDLMERAESDPRTFLLELPTENGLIIDEAQNCPALFNELLSIVDEDPRPGRFILTGSQNFALHAKISQSLAGRLGSVTLLPCSLQELRRADLPLRGVDQTIYEGFYPRVLFQGLSPMDWFPDYISFYVERDIRQLDQVSDLAAFTRLLKLCALRIGQQLNLESLAQDVGVSGATVRRWLSLLESSYVLFFLQPFHSNFNKRLTKTPKLYFYDTGLACSLLGFRGPEQILLHTIRGHLFENMVIADLLKESYNRRLPPRAYFWRDHSGCEVDLILDDPTGLVAVEIKINASLRALKGSALSLFGSLAEIPSERLFGIYGGEEDHGRLISWRTASQSLAPYL